MDRACGWAFWSTLSCKDTDNGHTFGSKIELVGDIYNSNIAGYGNNVYVVFASSRGVFFIKKD